MHCTWYATVCGRVHVCLCVCALYVLQSESEREYMSNVLRTTELLKLLKRNIATLQHNLLSKNVPFAGRNSLCMTSNYYLVCTKAREMTATLYLQQRYKVPLHGFTKQALNSFTRCILCLEHK